MGDVADILGAQKGQVQTEEEKLLTTINTSTAKASKPAKGKKKGIPRELMNLIGKSMIIIENPGVLETLHKHSGVGT
jgi:hypothetical protein